MARPSRLGGRLGVGGSGRPPSLSLGTVPSLPLSAPTAAPDPPPPAPAPTAMEMQLRLAILKERSVMSMDPVFTATSDPCLPAMDTVFTATDPCFTSSSHGSGRPRRSLFLASTTGVRGAEGHVLAQPRPSLLLPSGRPSPTDGACGDAAATSTRPTDGRLCPSPTRRTMTFGSTLTAHVVFRLTCTWQSCGRGY